MRYLALITTVVIFLCGCAADMPTVSSMDNPGISSQAAAESGSENSTVVASSEGSVSEIIPYVKSPKEEELTNLYNEKYLASAAQMGILSSSWKDAEDIPADDLPAFFMLDTLYKQYPDGWFNMLEVPSKEVEEGIQSHFDVTSEHIREAYNYNAETDCYSFGYGIGSEANQVVTDAKQEGDFLTLFYDGLDPADHLFTKGSVVIKLTKTGWKYISCEYQRLD